MSDTEGDSQDFEQAQLPPELQEQAIHPKGAGVPPIVGAVVGAAVGALVWALIRRYTGYEVGYVAWGIGGAVGWGAAALGGRGSAMGMTCGALALAAILCGKLLGAHLSFGAELDDWLNEPPSMAQYEERKFDAAAFVDMETDVDIKGFMIEHGFTGAEAVPDIDADEFEAFMENSAPALREFQANPVSFEDFQAQEQESLEEFRGVLEEGFSPVEAVKEDLSPIDLLFAALGVFTAFKMGSGAEPEAPTRRSARTQSTVAARKDE